MRCSLRSFYELAASILALDSHTKRSEAASLRNKIYNKTWLTVLVLVVSRIHGSLSLLSFNQTCEMTYNWFGHSPPTFPEEADVMTRRTHTMSCARNVGLHKGTVLFKLAAHVWPAAVDETRLRDCGSLFGPRKWTSASKRLVLCDCRLPGQCAIELYAAQRIRTTSDSLWVAVKPLRTIWNVSVD